MSTSATSPSTAVRKRVGILGGTFDPPHNGHLILAEQARVRFKLDRVVFIPTGRPNFKQGPAAPVASPEQRLAMTHLAVQDNPAFQVSDIEIARAGLTYTIDTLRQLQGGRARDLDGESGDSQLFYIIGSDVAQSLPHWYEAGELAGLCHFLVAGRAGAAPASLPAPFQGATFELPDLAVSSSQLRQMFAQGQPVRYLAPETVIGYIVAHGLYQKPR
ncbi:MAG: nicotinate-nucleotide adenylyltransferase [Coriobacteriales bacterium]|jgi:nicotinate-nucleotide adenylyltransferase|nr:nicotinate-nucleotide adenylyltransferase [Coriobacteriales bacterium]